MHCSVEWHASWLTLKPKTLESTFNNYTDTLRSNLFRW